MGSAGAGMCAPIRVAHAMCKALSVIATSCCKSCRAVLRGLAGNRSDTSPSSVHSVLGGQSRLKAAQTDVLLFPGLQARDAAGFMNNGLPRVRLCQEVEVHRRQFLRVRLTHGSLALLPGYVRWECDDIQDVLIPFCGLRPGVEAGLHGPRRRSHCFAR